MTLLSGCKREEVKPPSCQQWNIPPKLLELQTAPSLPEKPTWKQVLINRREALSTLNECLADKKAITILYNKRGKYGNSSLPK